MYEFASTEESTVLFEESEELIMELSKSIQSYKK